MFYDGNNWQEKCAFDPKIKTIGELFKLEIFLRKKDYDAGRVICVVNSPSNNLQIKESIISWNSIKCTTLEDYPNLVRITLEFGSFFRCGFFDWNLVLYLLNFNL
jgi:hypothetical protein